MPATVVSNAAARLRVDAEPATRCQKRVRCRLAAEMLGADRVAVHSLRDQCGESRAPEDRAGVGARRHNCQEQPRLARSFQILLRVCIGTYAFAIEKPHEHLVLAVGKPVHRFGARRIIDVTFRQPDATAGEKGMDALQARFAMEMLVVVGSRVERPESPEPLADTLEPAREELVEGVRPRDGVDSRAARQDAVEVEHTGKHAGRKPQHLPCCARPCKRTVDLDVLLACDRGEQPRRGLAFTDEPAFAFVQLLRRESETLAAAARHHQGIRCDRERRPPVSRQGIEVDDLPGGA